MSNDWTDWHQIWYTSADSSGNGHRLGGGGLGDHKFKSKGKMSNGWSDWHQLWFTSADSSGNGHRLNTSHPLNTPGGMSGGGGLGGHTFKTLGKLSNGWTDWHQIWYTSVDSSGNGHRLKQLAPRYSRAAFVVKRLDGLGINCAHVMQMNLGMDKG